MNQFKKYSIAAMLIVAVLVVDDRLATAADLSPVRLMFDNTAGDVLHRVDSRCQLVVSGEFSDGRLYDLTRAVSYNVMPRGIVKVSDNGQVTPLATGQVTVTAQHRSGVTAQQVLLVEGADSSEQVSFLNLVMPVLTKSGCNGGSCHGKAAGQNGFKLSLFGFYPLEDFETLALLSKGRRLFPAAPDQSLLLLKATASVGHGGGRRVDRGTYEYNMLRRWISQGALPSNLDEKSVKRIEVIPGTRVLSKEDHQQLRVVAYFSDETCEDVSHLVQYESQNPEAAEVSKTGLVEMNGQSGAATVLIRFQGHVDVFRALVPFGHPVQTLPTAHNFIDEMVFVRLKKMEIPPSPVSGDSMFLRRVTVDLAGRLPTLEETQQFLVDKNEAKRDRLIDRLLASTDYASYFANKWGALLRNRYSTNRDVGVNYQFHGWLRDHLHQNKPYDQFIREIVTASGELRANPPVAWHQEVDKQEERVEDLAQVFLGLRIACARCHHHPFDRWTQSDYHSLAAFFSQVKKKKLTDGVTHYARWRIFHDRGIASAEHPKTGEKLMPAGLGAKPPTLRPEDDPRHALVDWMVEPHNPFVARALVNRYWKHFFSVGIVDPEDDLRATNPPTNPELFDALAQHFVKSGFDMKDLIRTICRSTTYQLSSEPLKENIVDKQYYSRYYPKRLNAEVLYDELHIATGTPLRCGPFPVGVRAAHLPVHSIYVLDHMDFFKIFGRPEASTACECERSPDATLDQSLLMLTSKTVNDMLTFRNGRAIHLSSDKERSETEKVRELYLSLFSRLPKEKELKIALDHLAQGEHKHDVYEDLLWALLHTKEFMFIR